VTERAEIARRFAELAPWQTRFLVEGQAHGGDLDYSEDGRVPEFFRWFGAPRTILELGSAEGALTLQLAAPETVERVVALEARADHAARSRLALELLGRGNVESFAVDLEAADLAEHGRFDAVFCSGLLHRLVAPWRLLVEVGRVSDRLFLDTHYCFGDEAVEVDGYRGRWVVEGGPDPSTGVRLRSFWLTRPSLLEALTESGWAVRHVSDHPSWTVAPRIWLGCVRPLGAPQTEV